MCSMEEISHIINTKIRPQLNAHNGDIELLEITADGDVKVKLSGACATCPGAQRTLSDVVESALKEVCPDIKAVVPVYQVSDDLINQALTILRKNRRSQ